ncbi:MAG: type III pantothenate kinase [Zoogloeaceae bacterium]|nr:type III pantothenate kinase [Zoogloeaceae bacterium]
MSEAPIIAIDAGNSRIKWAVHDGEDWQARGVLATTDVNWLSEAIEDWPADARVVFCNVAGAGLAHTVHTLLAPRFGRPLEFSSTAAACGVSNSYERPQQLGADRWAALLGARAQADTACLVVCAGTATTVDVLTADGVFRGGVILPGLDLMRSALAGNTAQLPLAEGEWQATPRNTMDAIVSGCLNAQLGAIERMFALIADQPGARCVLTGGAATRLQAHLELPVQVEENLILDGLLCYARSAEPVVEHS